MILEGNQRGGARQMARHLTNTQDNEHVEVHEISGFMSGSVMGALDEIHAVSRGTKCKQYMFSVSLNPPHDVIAPVEYFEKAITQIEERNGLSGQPRVVVFHEKEGRRHAHCIWSRIDAVRGDRRGFVAVDYKGEVYSLSRWTGVKSKELKQRLNQPERLPDVQQVKIEISQSMSDVLKRHIDTVHDQRKQDYAPLKRTIQTMKTQHQNQRDSLEKQQKERWQQEEQQRIARLPRGLSGIWQRITGKYRTIKHQNQQEVQANGIRDRDERQVLINRQLQERQRLQERITQVRGQYHKDIQVLRKEVRHYHEVGEQALRSVQSEDHVHRHAHDMSPRL
jgi:hypothetical protein